MPRFRLPLALLACCLFTWMPSASATPEEASAAYAEGQKRLRQGDFEPALKAYLAASKADPENDLYRQETLLLQRTIRTRKGLDRLTGGEWLTAAEGLYVYFFEREVAGEALNLATKLHERQSDGVSTARLARTQLAFGRDAAAAELLRGLSDTMQTVETRALLAIALARQGETDAAKAALNSAVVSDDTSAAALFDLARARARVGQHEDALALLGACLERTPPSRLESVRTSARQSADLASLRSDAAFAKVLATESKVSESRCSSGASCAKCPSRTKCSGDADTAPTGANTVPEKAKPSKNKD